MRCAPSRCTPWSGRSRAPRPRPPPPWPRRPWPPPAPPGWSAPLSDPDCDLPHLPSLPTHTVALSFCWNMRYTTKAEVAHAVPQIGSPAPGGGGRCGAPGAARRGLQLPLLVLLGRGVRQAADHLLLELVQPGRDQLAG